MSSKLDDDINRAVGTIAAWVIVAALFVVAVAGWMVATQLYRHPDCKPLWAALGLAIFATTLAVGAQGRFPELNLLAALAITALVVTASIVKIHYDPLVQRQANKELSIHDVLSRPWN